MTDKKISALPSAATPLAGTELVPIVQSNATVNVSVVNLTAGRTVNGNNFVASNGFASTGASNVVNGSTSILDNSSGARLISYGPDAGTRGSTSVIHATSTGGAAVTVGTFAANGGFTSASLAMSSGSLTPSTAGQGVNFTANTPAAGNTSQLLNDYQEGTWTPTDQSGAGLSFTLGSCTYVKSGNQVTATFDVTFPTTASAATVAISLPFATHSTAWACGAVAFSTYAGTAGFGGGPSSSTTNAFNTVGGAGTAYQNVNFSGRRFIVSFTYRSA